MKSIMEEASTVFKAIEKAWIRAEKPSSFSIKVLEEPVKNFIGMTVKSAKIAFYFDEMPVQKTKQHQQAPTQQRKAHSTGEAQPQHKQRRDEPREQHGATQERKPRVQQPQQPKQQTKVATPKVAEPAPAPRVKPELESHESMPAAIWKAEVLVSAEQWLRETISQLGSESTFTSTAINNQLTIQFNKPIAEQANERMLMSALAQLMMQSLRHRYKDEVRGLKVMLKSE